MQESDGSPGYRVVDRRWWARDEDEGAEPDRGPTVIARLEAQIAERDRALRETAARHREAVEELSSARARIERDAERAIERGRRDVLASLLPVLDDLDRAIEAARGAGAGGAAALVEGVELVRAGFLDRLRGHGIERVDPAGAAFDPARHEAVSVVPAGPERPAGQVVATVLPGYEMAGEALRPARVVVAR